MKEENKIKLAQIATVLNTITNGGRIYNGDEDAVLMKVSGLNDLGKQINEIINDELNKKK